MSIVISPCIALEKNEHFVSQNTPSVPSTGMPDESNYRETMACELYEPYKTLDDRVEAELHYPGNCLAKFKSAHDAGMFIVRSGIMIRPENKCNLCKKSNFYSRPASLQYFALSHSNVTLTCLNNCRSFNHDGIPNSNITSNKFVDEIERKITKPVRWP